MRDDKYLLTQEQVEQIRQILEKGDRVELIPGKERIKIIQESRKEIKQCTPDVNLMKRKFS